MTEWICIRVHGTRFYRVNDPQGLAHAGIVDDFGQIVIVGVQS